MAILIGNLWCLSCGGTVVTYYSSHGTTMGLSKMGPHKQIPLIRLSKT